MTNQLILNPSCLQGYSSNLVLPFDEVEGLTRDKTGYTEAAEAEISQLFVPKMSQAQKTSGSYISQNATQ